MPNGLPAGRSHGHTSFPVMTGNSSEAIGRHKGDCWQDHNKEDKDPGEDPKTSPSKETTGERDNDLKTNESINNGRNSHQKLNRWLQETSSFGRNFCHKNSCSNGKWRCQKGRKQGYNKGT